VLRDPEVFRTIRGLLTSGSALHEHSLAVAMLSIGLASRVMSGDPEVLLTAGMAGLLHDVGRVGRDPADADQGHTTRGFKLLRGLGLPVPVCRAALSHHERLDGSGFPDGVGGDAIPLMARLVGVVDTFHRVYTESGGSRGGPQPVPDPAPGGGTGGGSGGVPGGGPGGVRRGVPGGAPRIGDANLGDARGDVYRALRVMAQVYRGCFDPKLVTALLQLFGR
jgi:putative nucleotidyltransferase with HDIG domain